jgi:hypothetical protein
MIFKISAITFGYGRPVDRVGGESAIRVRLRDQCLEFLILSRD